MVFLQALDRRHLGELGLQRHARPIDDAQEGGARIRRGSVGECGERNLQREQAGCEQAQEFHGRCASLMPDPFC